MLDRVTGCKIYSLKNKGLLFKIMATVLLAF